MKHIEIEESTDGKRVYITLFNEYIKGLRKMTANSLEVEFE